MAWSARRKHLRLLNILVRHLHVGELTGCAKLNITFESWTTLLAVENMWDKLLRLLSKHYTSICTVLLADGKNHMIFSLCFIKENLSVRVLTRCRINLIFFRKWLNLLFIGLQILHRGCSFTLMYLGFCVFHFSRKRNLLRLLWLSIWKF